MEKMKIIGWELTKNKNGVEMATLNAELLRNYIKYVEELEKEVDINEIIKTYKNRKEQFIEADKLVRELAELDKMKAIQSNHEELIQLMITSQSYVKQNPK